MEVIEGVTAGEIISNYQGMGVNFTSEEHGIFHLAFTDATSVYVSQSEYGYPHDTLFMWAARDVTLGCRFTRRLDGVWTMSTEAHISVRWGDRELTPRMVAAVRVYVDTVVNAYLTRPEVAGVLLAADVARSKADYDKADKEARANYDAWVEARSKAIDLEIRYAKSRRALAAHEARGNSGK